MVECATQELIQIQSSNTQRGQDEWLSQTNRVTSLPSARDSSSCSMLTLIRGYDHPPFINISPVFDFLVYIRVSEFSVIKCNTFWNLKKSSKLSNECGHLVYRNLCAQCSGQWSTLFHCLVLLVFCICQWQTVFSATDSCFFSFIGLDDWKLKK